MIEYEYISRAATFPTESGVECTRKDDLRFCTFERSTLATRIATILSGGTQ